MNANKQHITNVRMKSEKWIKGYSTKVEMWSHPEGEKKIIILIQWLIAYQLEIFHITQALN